MRMGQDKAKKVAPFLDHVTDVGKNEINPWMFLAAKRHAKIDRNPLPAGRVAHAVNRQIHADLAHAAKRRKDKFVLKVCHQIKPAAVRPNPPRSPARCTTSPAVTTCREPSRMRITKPPVSSSVSKCPTISRSARRTRMADPRPAARVNQSARTATKFSALFHCSIRSTILRESVAKSDTAETPIQAAARSVAGYSVPGGWLTQLTPTPITTAPAPSPSMRMPASLASPRRRSLGHLIARGGLRGPAASLTASCTARAATKANSEHRLGG